MATSSSSWPQSLKEWVQRSLGQSTTSNKDAVHAELKKVIFDAYRTNTVWEKDWTKVELESLKPPAPKATKRKMTEPAASPKPAKMAKKISIQIPANDSEDLRQKRARRFEREHEIERARQAGTGPQHTYSRHVNAPADVGSLADRMEMLSSGSKGLSPQRKRLYSYQESPENAYDPNVLDWDKHTIVGKCETREKSYLRLTTASMDPDPATIRPLHVLQETLNLLKRKWREERNYVYICDQFKSLRQDLTVQRIKNSFTVTVYEIHARIALESKDLVEYNQCQSALKTLHSLGLEGHYEEFLAYRILYMLYTRARSDLNLLISQLTPAQKANDCIVHALAVQKALATNNYHAFFELFKSAPAMGGYMMDFYLDRERIAALIVMTKSYRKLALSFIASELAFDNSSDAAKFLQDNGVAFWEGVAPSTSRPSGSWRPVQATIPDKDKVFSNFAEANPILVQLMATKYRRLDIVGRI